MSACRRGAAPLLLVALLAVCAAEQQQYSERSISLQQFIHEVVKKETNKLSGRLDATQELLGELVLKVGSQESKMDGIQTRLGGIATTVKSVSRRLSAEESETIDLVTALESLQTQMSRLESGVSRNADQTDFLANRVEQLEAQLPPRDCSGLPSNSTSGVYLLQLGRSRPPVSAYCDMDTDGGGWTVFQRRGKVAPHKNFQLPWISYQYGFGDRAGDFWWGLEKLHQLTWTYDRRYELRVDLEAFDGDKAFAEYQAFKISPERDGYALHVANFTGNAGDGLRYNVDRLFSTYDNDQDGWSDGNCAAHHKGAWWYGPGNWYCGGSKLNGRYLEGGPEDVTGIEWYVWKGHTSLAQTEMKIRRV